MVGDLAPGRLVLAGPMSLSGRYAALGRLAADGLRQVVEDVANAGGVEVGGRTLIPVLVLLDDESTRDGVRRRLDSIGGIKRRYSQSGRSIQDQRQHHI